MSSLAEQVQRVCSKIESGDVSEWENLKFELHKLPIVSVIDEDTKLTPEQDAQAKLAIKALETIIFFAVKQNSIDLFESNITFLLSLYSLDPSSVRRIEVFSLYLIHLLTKDNIAQFHIELEKVPLELQSTDIYLSFVVRLEQAFMEGCFVTFGKLCNSALSDDKFSHFFVFLRVLALKVRVRVAECCENAFARRTLSAEEMRTEYLGVNKDDFETICKERGWVVGLDGLIDFCPTADVVESKNTRNESLQLLNVSTRIANELGQLV